MTRVWHMAKKEIIQTFRDKRMFGVLFFAPVFQLFIFGYAATTDVRHINLAVLDLDRSAASRRLVEAFAASGYFTLAGSLEGDADLENAVVRGLADVAIVIPADYERRLARGEKVDVQAIFDASDSNFAQVAAGYSRGIMTRIAADATGAHLGRLRALAVAQGLTPAPMPSLDVRPRVWFNPELKSVFYMVPGVICMLLMIVTMMLSALAITREREIGTIEQVIVSPIAPWELILGKLAPFAVLGLVNVALIMTIAVWHFHVPIRGSIALIYGASGLFLFSTLGIGLFLSSISTTQQQAMFVSFMFIMPAILLSGFMFPIENMPRAVQILTYANPLRYFLEVIRGVFLKGNGVDVLWPQLAALGVFGVAIFTLAGATFTKRVG